MPNSCRQKSLNLKSLTIIRLCQSLSSPTPQLQNYGKHGLCVTLPGVAGFVVSTPKHLSGAGD